MNILQGQEKGAEEERRTFSLVAVLGSMTLRMSRVSCDREEPTGPCFMTKDLGMSSWVDVEDCIPFKWVRFLRLRVILIVNERHNRAGPVPHFGGG